MTNPRTSARSSTVIRWVALAAIIFAVVATLAPAASQEAEATTCPPGYVPGPDKDIVNSDGSISRTPGDCVQAGSVNVQGGLLGNVDAQDQNDVATPEVEGIQRSNSDAVEVEITESPDPGYLTFHTYDCQGAYAWTSMSIDQLHTVCPTQPGVKFDVSNVDSDGITTYQKLGVTDVDGLAFFQVGLPGTVYASEYLPTGYGDPIVFCGVVSGPGSGLGQLTMVTAAGGSAALPIEAGQQLYCDWFNILPVTVEVPTIQYRGGGLLTIRKYVCPEYIDAYETDDFNLFVQCIVPLKGVSFEVTDGIKIVRSGATNDLGFVDLGGVPAKELTITEQIPQGYGEPVVVCASSETANLPSAVTTVPVVGGASVQFTFNPDQRVECTWFNVPVAGTAGEEAHTGEVEVHKLICPPLTSPQNGVQSVAKGDRPAPCTELELVPGEGFGFTLTVDAIDYGTKNTDDAGWVRWESLPGGTLSLTEEPAPGYAPPFFQCFSGDSIDTATTPAVVTLKGRMIVVGLEAGAALKCYVINVPGPEGYGTVEIYKWECDEDPGISTNMPMHLEAAGCELVEGVPFSLSYGIDTILAKNSGDDGAGHIYWTGLPAGSISVTETIPSGYGEPSIYCSSELPRTKSGQGSNAIEIVGATVTTELVEGQWMICHWVNLPHDDSSITIYKYTCVEGFDIHADGADPALDCQEYANGVYFDLTDSYGTVTTKITGALQLGHAYWGELAPGDYVVAEQVPAGTGLVFVLECTGGDEWIQNTPLSVGSDLSIHLDEGQNIVCHWFNVPVPEWGSVTVIKYACDSLHFIAPHYCEIYEEGAQFELLQWSGGSSTVAESGTTSSAGTLTWNALDAGFYELEEIGRTWCYAETDRPAADGTLLVEKGESTTVWVYNCDVTATTKSPVTYPNTGAGGASVAQSSPAPVEDVGSYKALPQNRMIGVNDSRIAASMQMPDRPVEIAIEAIEVRAEIEVLEVVDGRFEDPTTSDVVAWYKDTGRPGMPGTMVMAGHLNYWGDPEGVFFALNEVAVGEEIVITTASGMRFRYIVVNTALLVATETTLAEVTDSDEEALLTLITCGGTWDPETQTYLDRTVVQARLIS